MQGLEVYGSLGVKRLMSEICWAHNKWNKIASDIKLIFHSSNMDNFLWFQTFAVFWIYYVFFWVVPRRLNYIRRRFGTFYLFHLHRQVVRSAYEDGTECSETSAYIIQTPGNYPKENIIYSEHGENLKSRIRYIMELIKRGTLFVTRQQLFMSLKIPKLWPLVPHLKTV